MILFAQFLISLLSSHFYLKGKILKKLNRPAEEYLEAYKKSESLAPPEMSHIARYKLHSSLFKLLISLNFSDYDLLYKYVAQNSEKESIKKEINSQASNKMEREKEKHENESTSFQDFATPHPLVSSPGRATKLLRSIRNALESCHQLNSKGVHTYHKSVFMLSETYRVCKNPKFKKRFNILESLFETEKVPLQKTRARKFLFKDEGPLLTGVDKLGMRYHDRMDSYAKKYLDTYIPMLSEKKDLVSLRKLFQRLETFNSKSIFNKFSSEVFLRLACAPLVGFDSLEKLVGMEEMERDLGENDPTQEMAKAKLSEEASEVMFACHLLSTLSDARLKESKPTNGAHASLKKTSEEMNDALVRVYKLNARLKGISSSSSFTLNQIKEDCDTWAKKFVGEKPTTSKKAKPTKRKLEKSEIKKEGKEESGEKKKATRKSSSRKSPPTKKSRTSNSYTIPYYLPKGTNESEVHFPLIFGSISIESLGEIPESPEKFHDKNYIYPPGFRSVKMYNLKNKGKTKFISEILNVQGELKFQVTVEGMAKPFVGNKTSSVWKSALSRGKKNISVSGPEYFGLSIPFVRKLIQELPNANLCSKYVRINFVSNNELGVEASEESQTRGKMGGENAEVKMEDENHEEEQATPAEPIQESFQMDSIPIDPIVHANDQMDFFNSELNAQTPILPMLRTTFDMEENLDIEN